jgi:hypothetical protein
MPFNRPLRKLVVLALLATVVAALTQVGAQAAGSRPHAARACAAAGERGNPNAVPPILPPVPCSDVAAVTQAEALETTAFFYRAPTSAYSDTEMRLYATVARRR